MSEAANEIDQEESPEGERVREIADAMSEFFRLMKITDEVVAKVALTVMLNAYMHGYKGDHAAASRQLESFVGETMRAYRAAKGIPEIDESSRLILPGMSH